MHSEALLCARHVVAIEVTWIVHLLITHLSNNVYETPAVFQALFQQLGKL